MASRVLRLAAFCTLCESAAGLAVSQAAGYQVSRSEVLRTGSSASEVAPAPEVFLAVATLAPALAGAPGPAPPPPALAAAPPKVGPCVPQCTWECETSKCDQAVSLYAKRRDVRRGAPTPTTRAALAAAGSRSAPALPKDCLRRPGLRGVQDLLQRADLPAEVPRLAAMPQRVRAPEVRMAVQQASGVPASAVQNGLRRAKNCPYTKFHYELPPRKDGEVAINAFRSQGDTPLATVTGGPPPFAARWKRGAPDSPDVKECASCSKKSGA
eukprot:CAMPEP_0183397048 /NCGR_PEP_ID=MMETSP0370-20130417/10337_1 /TAXON_ID=268820 /ORGANISM="Peridinium aciculiferum, Strain PAER-2" /LENGTH=268 /DNA_ID=CAMNT_0025577875 /DNA_START=63 /DNA_END=872 /DNA_ORIENTATION=-